MTSPNDALGTKLRKYLQILVTTTDFDLFSENRIADKEIVGGDVYCASLAELVAQ